MLLIKKLPPKYINGRCVSYGKFLCIFCNIEVEKELGQGKRDKSCGCMRDEFSKKHSACGTRLYKIWDGMKQRTTNPKAKNYYRYGGRGITICPEWTNGFINFRNWALNNSYADNLTIDRINNNGNYEPNNCQWITQKENSRKAGNIKLTIQKANNIRKLYKTNKYTQKELAEKYNVSQLTISDIVNKKTWRNC